MKINLLLLLLLLSTARAFAQFPPSSDTVFLANFESASIFEPDSLPQSQPTGHDNGWVNWDEDGFPQFCFSDTVTHGWYPAYDLTDIHDTTSNFAFTSCSYTNNDIHPCGKKTRNWLILPPVQIVGNQAKLTWKSTTYYGPYWVDGYKVLASTTDNFAGSFKDTLFTAAEMVRVIPPTPFGTSLNPAKYEYSKGYVHADKYTLPQYFFLNVDPTVDLPYYHGKFEPHSADLSKFAGKQLYLAFLHDSECDFQLQVDDIVVVDDGIIASREPSELADFSVRPNPVSDRANIQFSMKNPAEVALQLVNSAGQIVWQRLSPNGQNRAAQILADWSGLPAGSYVCRLVAGAEVRQMPVFKI